MLTFGHGSIMVEFKWLCCNCNEIVTTEEVGSVKEIPSYSGSLMFETEIWCKKCLDKPTDKV